MYRTHDTHLQVATQQSSEKIVPRAPYMFKDIHMDQRRCVCSYRYTTTIAYVCSSRPCRWHSGMTLPLSDVRDQSLLTPRGWGKGTRVARRNATQGVPFLVWSLSKLLTSEAQLQSSTLYDQIAYLWVVLL